MTQSLKPVENTGLSVANGLVQVKHSAGENLDVNLTAFLLTDAGRVEADIDMMFFNAPVHASGAARFSPPSNQAGVVRHSISIDLSRLPAGISKIAITLTQDGSGGGFAPVKDLSAQGIVGDQVLMLTPGEVQSETGITVLDLYVRNGQAKARAVRQGFATGLTGLCNPLRTAEALYEKATLALAAQVAFFISCAYLVREFGKSEIRSVLAEK